MDNKKLQFSVVNPQSANISNDLVEVKVNNTDYVYYGTDNKYPNYLLDCYLKCSSLSSIIQGTVDYINGEGIETTSSFLNGEINQKGQTLDELLSKLYVDYMIFGGFAIQVFRDINGNVTDLIWLDFSKCRTNSDETKIYYSNDWGKSSANAIEYDSYSKKSTNSIFYYKGTKTRGVYPIPIYNAALMSIETQIEIKKFHKNSILNNFNANVLININSGIPTEEEKKEIEKKIENKFTGSENSGKFLMSYNDSKESATEIIRLESDNFDEKYQALNTSSIQDIFIAFRAIPSLFGLMTETTGFSSQEFNEAFKLYNKVTISPIQQMFENIIYKITGETFKHIPFKLDYEEFKNRRIKYEI